MSSASTSAKPVVGLIMTGGGARAAYQVGVMRALHDMLPQGVSNPFPIIFDLGAMAAGWRAAKKLAGGDDGRVIPGHDPDVRRRFPEVAGQGGEVVALHLQPKD
jgi:hypothetical protein